MALPLAADAHRAALAVLVAAGLSVGAPAAPARGDDATLGAPPPSEAGAWTHVLLPGEGPFERLLADPKEARFQASYQRVRLLTSAFPSIDGERTFDGGFLSAGAPVGLWEATSPSGDQRAQVGLYGGVFAQLALGSLGLLNTDFVVGAAASGRHGALSARARLYHQSSHLGDELLVEVPELERVNLSFEGIDALVSWEHAWLRLYGGGGVLLRTEPDLDRGSAQWGLEVRAPERLAEVAGLALVPVGGTDFQALAEREWAVAASLAAGVEVTGLVSERTLRLLATYFRGHTPYGQFYATERVETYGVELLLDL